MEPITITATQAEALRDAMRACEFTIAENGWVAEATVNVAGAGAWCVAADCAWPADPAQGEGPDYQVFPDGADGVIVAS